MFSSVLSKVSVENCDDSDSNLLKNVHKDPYRVEHRVPLPLVILVYCNVVHDIIHVLKGTTLAILALKYHLI